MMPSISFTSMTLRLDRALTNFSGAGSSGAAGAKNNTTWWIIRLGAAPDWALDEQKPFGLIRYISGFR